MAARFGLISLGPVFRRDAALMATLVVLPLVARTGAAQGWPAIPEVRPFVGTYLPTGQHHHLLDQSIVLGAQVALEFARGAHAVAAFSWMPTEQRLLTSGNRVEMAQFDLGAEWLSPGRRRLHSRFNPLLGAGVGMRAYRSRDVDTPSQSNLAAYGALGFEVKAGRFAVRLEGRDYVSAFKGLNGTEGTSMRNDATVGIGLGYHLP